MDQTPQTRAPQPRGEWKSRLGFILAASGSAVGLGNIWKFPYITGENGGGLFVIIYLVCIALVGLPIMMAEIMIGRAAQRQPVEAFHALQGRRTGWAAVGWLGVVAGFVILSYYIVVAGWAMDYTIKSAANFTGPIQREAAAEALEYRAGTPVDQMRQELAASQAVEDAESDIVQIRQELPPAVWTAYQQFQGALDAANGSDEARAALLEDLTLRQHVEQAEPVQQRIDERMAEAEEEALAYFENLPDKDVRDLAQTAKRREVIFDRVQASFIAVASDGWTTTFWAALFMVIVIAIVAMGISGGIERACTILMPTLFVLILVMVVYGAFKPGFGAAVEFVFKPDVHKLQASGVLEALGHAFFTLSLGMGAMITYGSYQRSKEGLAAESVTIAGLDTGVALLACLMMFPIVLSYGQEPSAGPGLVFMSMPLAFAEIGMGGMLLSLIFFGLVVFAALTSAISLLEVVASYFMDAHNWPRVRAAVLLGVAIFLFGIPSAFSMDEGFLMTGWEPSFGLNFFDTMDYLASNWMLPLGGLLISVYAGWVMPRRMREAEVRGLAPMLFTGWLLLVRYVAPLLVILVLMQKVGILDADQLLHGLFH